ncbi:telomere length regulation protein TEL2 homolog [Bicyclus anynana]|uniref:Telomere length regulation protein TEL2 homolog n=2 Tax=Satyrini TaxID=127320 RepID=A0ABM3M129_BICAN|nr:telomere length regulation protein TEL2 homolog [Bicyclus anynana]
MDRFISMWKVRELADKVTNVVMNYTEVEGKVREATSDEAWGPTGQQMQELALATFTYEHFPEVMSMLWRRMLHDNRAHWRRTYKCLLLLSYLVRNGSERVVTSAREHIYDLRSLENYTFADELGKDQGINVRHKVRELIDFIQDDERLREERKKAKKNKDKYIGMSSEAVVMGSRGGMGGMGGMGVGGGGGAGGWGEYSDRSGGWDENKERNDEDEYEREDSDGDYGHRKPQKENVYRDAEVIAESPPRSERARDGKALSISLRSPARQKPTTPVKKIDLGAAASYGKSFPAPASASASAPAPAAAPPNTHKSQELLDDLFKTCAAPSPAPTPTRAHDAHAPVGALLEDDFDPRAGEPKPAPKPEAEFGDFANAFGAPAEAPGSFADFSAFDNNNPPPAATAPPAAPASNLDLLSELSAPPTSPPSSMGFDLDSLSGQFAGASLAPTLQPTGDKLRADKHTTDLMLYIRNFIDTLRAIERIKSQNEVLNVLSCFDNVKRYLPGPLTVQKVMSHDQKIIKTEVIDLYSELLGSVVRIMLPHWPSFQEEATYLFTMEEGFQISHEILANLCGFLKDERNNLVLEALTMITLKYVRSDAILASILDCSVDVSCRNNLEMQTEWENYIQLLATLPERVANMLKTKTPKEFSYENYSFVLLFHIVRSIDFMAECSFREGTQFDLTYLALLVSKFITNYSLSDSEGIYKLVDVLIAWTDNNSSDSCKFVRRKLIQTLLNRINRQAIDKISLVILKRSPINYRNRDQCIRYLLGNNIDSNKDWHEILTFRVPFYVHPKSFTDTTIPENLIYYVSISKNSHDILTELVLRLAKTWADVHLNNIANIEHHMHTCVLLVLAVKYRVVIWRQRKSAWDVNDIKKILYKGMSKHLDVISEDFRCAGMATVEILLKMLVEVDDSDKKAVELLNFKLDELGPRCVEIYETLKNVTQKCLIVDKLKKPNTTVRVINVKDILDEVAERISGKIEAPVHNTIVTCAVKGPEQTKEIVKTIISAKLDALGKRQQVEELDSDDDLQPYDMSNDVPTAARKKPKYLRDLIETLNDGNDQESFEAGLAVAEELIKQQLKNEDKKLATELLDLFVHLEEKFYVIEFMAIKLNIAAAIVCSHPAACAVHLCKEIHSDVGRYSISTKMFMLDILSEAVVKITAIKKQEDTVYTGPQNVLKETPREEIMRRRLLSKTKYFHSYQQHPFAKLTKNEFAAVSDYFFYPLVNGFGDRQLTLSHHNTKQDVESLLLLKYLSTVGTIIIASANCPKCLVYCREILQMILYLRFTPDPKIQLCVISLIATVIAALPDSILREEFGDTIMELSAWLVDLMTNGDLTNRLGGPKSESVIYAGEVLHVIEGIMAL